ADTAHQERTRAKSEAQAPSSVSKNAAGGPGQAAVSSSKAATQPAPASTLNEQIDRKESQVSAAAAAWLVGANAGETAAQPEEGDDPRAAVPPKAVQPDDQHQANELDPAAPSPAPAQSRR